LDGRAHWSIAALIAQHWLIALWKELARAKLGYPHAVHDEYMVENVPWVS